MFIEKIHIDTFGKLSDFDLELTPGMNILEGANESGKSTLAAFIKFIFYGVSSREREQIMSWKTGGAAGSLTVSVDSHKYRIERAVVGNREAVQLVDGENNMPIRHALDEKTPGELFFGVDAEMFVSTAFVSQLGGTTAGGTKLSEGIENILFSGDENVNTQRAIAKLDAARAALLHKNEKGGRLYEIDNECALLEVKLAEALRIHEDILSKEAQLDDSREKLNSAAQKADGIGAKIQQFEANALIELFERRRLIESRISVLSERLRTDNDRESAAASRMEKYSSRLVVLKKELDETIFREEECQQYQPSRELEEFLKMGGKDAVETKKKRLFAKAKGCTAAGVIALLAGIALVLFGIMPILNEAAINVLFAAAGGGLSIVGVILLALGARFRGQASDVELYYDLDTLEAEAAEYRGAQEAAKFTNLAVIDARRRYNELCDEIRQEYGCDPEELSEKHEQQKRKAQESSGVKAEYDKHISLLSQIDAQLKPYSEEELRATVDSGVDISDVDASELSSMRREAEFAAKMAASLEKHCIELEKELAGLYPIADDPKLIADRLSSMKARRAELQKKHAAYKLANEKLSEAGESLRLSIAPRLASEAARNMAAITGGKYNNLGVGADLSMSAETESGQRSLGVLSAGTQDAAYLSLRLSLISLLYSKTEPPIIYDESFIRQDDERLKKLLRLIATGKSQSLIFTANDREASLMRDIGEFKHIRM